MNLLEMLESLGDRLGIVARVPDSGPVHAPKIEMRVITLTDLTSEIRRDEIKSLADQPAELSVPFEKVIEAAGIPAQPHGWTIEKLRQLLRSDAFNGLAQDQAQLRILGVLGEEKVNPEDLVRDAVSRDQALDAFEKFARKKMDDRLIARKRRLAEIESQIADLHAEAAKLNDQSQDDAARWKEWRRQKRERERDLAWCVGYLIDKPVITTDDKD